MKKNKGSVVSIETMRGEIRKQKLIPGYHMNRLGQNIEWELYRLQEDGFATYDVDNSTAKYHDLKAEIKELETQSKNMLIDCKEQINSILNYDEEMGAELKEKLEPLEGKSKEFGRDGKRSKEIQELITELEDLSKSITVKTEVINKEKEKLVSGLDKKAKLIQKRREELQEPWSNLILPQVEIDDLLGSITHYQAMSNNLQEPGLKGILNNRYQIISRQLSALEERLAGNARERGVDDYRTRIFNIIAKGDKFEKVTITVVVSDSRGGDS